MRKITLIFCIAFTILTFVGALYVLLNDRNVNAGFAVVPMIFAIVLMGIYRNSKK